MDPESLELGQKELAEEVGEGLEERVEDTEDVGMTILKSMLRTSRDMSVKCRETRRCSVRQGIVKLEARGS